MKSNKGFTLIELLVVVLIIGILAAIAVPQYQKAVKKSRATEAIMNLKSIMQAQEIYYLANDTYTTNLNNLDIKLGSDNYIYTCFNGSTIFCYARPRFTEQYYFDLTKGYPLLCRGTKEDCSFIASTTLGNPKDNYWIVDL